MTNGTRYGIVGELVTDCRYLSLAGAHAAIDSESGIAERRAYLDQQRRAFVEYIERGASTLRCVCGWRGRYDGQDQALAKLLCPKCSDCIFLVAE